MGSAMSSSMSYFFASNASQQLFDYQNDCHNNDSNEKQNDKNDNLNDDNHDNDDNDDNEDYLYKDVYLLNIYIDPSVPETTRTNYINRSNDCNRLIDEYLTLNYNNENYYISDYCFDAGFDLFNVDNLTIDKTFADNNFNIVLDHQIKCSMTFNHNYVSYYLYPRSSVSTKTPLRLANSVGIIDSGYRGNIKAVFDINQSYFNINDTFDLEVNSRYTQITPPDLSNFPMKVYIVNDINDLGGVTTRGQSAFGSSGR